MVKNNIVLQILPIPKQGEKGYVDFTVEKLQNKNSKLIKKKVIDYLKKYGIKQIKLPKDKY